MRNERKAQNSNDQLPFPYRSRVEADEASVKDHARRISRRKLLGLGGVGAVAAVAVALSGKGEEVLKFLAGEKATAEQEEAFEHLKTGSGTVENLVVGGEPDFKVNIRNRPYTYRGVDMSSGAPRGQVSGGTWFQEGWPILGNDPDHAEVPSEHDVWFGVWNPEHDYSARDKTPKDVVFINHRYFVQTEEVRKAATAAITR